MTTTTVPLGLAEQTEIRAYSDFVAGAPAFLRESLGVGRLEIGSTTAVAVRGEPTGFFDRAGGFGSERPVDANIVAQVVAFYQEQRVASGTFMLAPSVLPPDWAAIADKFDLTEGRTVTKLGCDVGTAVSRAYDANALHEDLRVGLVEPDEAGEWAAATVSAFGWTAQRMAETAAACVGRPDWRQYAVWDGAEIIAVGGVFLNGDCAGMFGAASLPGRHRCGAHSALLAVRARAAREAGCRWLVAEAVRQAPGERDSALGDLSRIGFERLYERVDWVWHA